jgi:hypothetical protein
MLTGQRTLQSRVPEAVGWSMLSPLHARAARGRRVNTVTIPAASAKESNAKMAAFFNSQSSTPLTPGRPGRRPRQHQHDSVNVSNRKCGRLHNSDRAACVRRTLSEMSGRARLCVSSVVLAVAPKDTSKPRGLSPPHSGHVVSRRSDGKSGRLRALIAADGCRC